MPASVRMRHTCGCWQVNEPHHTQSSTTQRVLFHHVTFHSIRVRQQNEIRAACADQRAARSVGGSGAHPDNSPSCPPQLPPAFPAPFECGVHAGPHFCACCCLRKKNMSTVCARTAAVLPLGRHAVMAANVCHRPGRQPCRNHTRRAAAVACHTLFWLAATLYVVLEGGACPGTPPCGRLGLYKPEMLVPSFSETALHATNGPLAPPAHHQRPSYTVTACLLHCWKANWTRNGRLDGSQRGRKR